MHTEEEQLGRGADQRQRCLHGMALEATPFDWCSFYALFWNVSSRGRDTCRGERQRRQRLCAARAAPRVSAHVDAELRQSRASASAPRDAPAVLAVRLGITGEKAAQGRASAATQHTNVQEHVRVGPRCRNLQCQAAPLGGRDASHASPLLRPQDKGIKCKVNIPDTVLFRHGQLSAWWSTNKVRTLARPWSPPVRAPHHAPLTTPPAACPSTRRRGASRGTPARARPWRPSASASWPWRRRMTQTTPSSSPSPGSVRRPSSLR